MPGIAISKAVEDAMTSCRRASTLEYLDGKLEDFEYPREAVEASMAKLPKVG